MKLLIVFFILAFPLISKADYFNEKVAASKAAAFLNRTKTPAESMREMSAWLTDDEITGLNALLVGADMTEPFPNAIAAGGKLSFVGSKFAVEFRKDRSLKINGRIYQASERGSLDKFVGKVITDLRGTTGMLSLVLPQAHAGRTDPMKGDIPRVIYEAAMGQQLARAGNIEIYLNMPARDIAENEIKCSADGSFIVQLKDGAQPTTPNLTPQQLKDTVVRGMGMIVGCEFRAHSCRSVLVTREELQNVSNSTDPVVCNEKTLAGIRELIWHNANMHQHGIRPVPTRMGEAPR